MLFRSYAIEVADDDDASQSEVDNAVNALSRAIKNLVSTVTADKSDLDDAIADAKLRDESDYTADSWSVLQRRLRAAEEVSGNNSATQSAVDVALLQLNTAIDNLIEEKADANKDKLNEAIVTAKAKKEADYTSTSWNAMQSKLQAAQNVLDKDDATQKEVDDAVKALNDAVKALTSNSGTDNSTNDAIEFRCHPPATASISVPAERR